MMIFRSHLPRWPNRSIAGYCGIWQETGTGLWVLGPYPCLGKADNAKAIDHKNPDRNPQKPFGDHPTGVYEITNVIELDGLTRSYGTWKIVIQPVHGDCVFREAAEPGDDGILAHGGEPGGPYSHKLRATNGC